jgi:hypothetical protein
VKPLAPQHARYAGVRRLSEALDKQPGATFPLVGQHADSVDAAASMIRHLVEARPSKFSLK